jgi:penicillin-binding protein 1A
LRNLPISEPKPAEGLVQIGGEWFYSEFSGNNGISSLGGNNDTSGQADAVQPQEERKRILDLFRN